MTLQHTAAPVAAPVPPPVSVTGRQRPMAWARSRASVRPIAPGDAESLAASVTSETVTRFIPPPPSTADRFRAFIAWARGEQRAGRQRCYAIVPHGSTKAAGLIQVRHNDANPSIVEWGFVLAQPLWGTGLFVESAVAVLDTLFGQRGVQCVEAHTALVNQRGMGVLKKLGFQLQDECAGLLTATSGTFDQARWAMTAAEWRIVRRRFIAA